MASMAASTSSLRSSELTGIPLRKASASPRFASSRSNVALSSNSRSTSSSQQLLTTRAWHRTHARARLSRSENPQILHSALPLSPSHSSRKFFAKASESGIDGEASQSVLTLAPSEVDARTEPSSTNGVAPPGTPDKPKPSPLPKFMVDQAKLLDGDSDTTSAGEGFVPGPKKAPPKKLALQDKATAPWGWGGKGVSVGSTTVREDRSLNELEKWLTKKGLPNQKLALSLVKEGGRGLVAREEIGKGEALLSVPESLMMTPDKAYESVPAGPLLKAAKVPEWPALAVFLLLECGKKDRSDWSTYISTLPQTPPCILQWSPEEVDVLLKGSPVQRKAIECIADVTSTYQDLDRVLFSKHRDTFPEELFTLGLFKWAFAILFSRMVRLKSLGGKLALVPWADMLNHRCEVESYLDYDSWRKAIVFKTDRKYSKGKEVFASYGPRSNGSLLLAYGVVPTSRNPSDAVDITLGFDPSDPALPLKEASLAKHGLKSPLSFPLQLEGWPSQLMAFLRLSALDPSSNSQMIERLALEVASQENGIGNILKPGGSGNGAFSLDVEIRAREALVASCQVALEGYQTTLQEDEAVLAGILDDYLEDDGEQRVRVLAATALRVSERRILLKTDYVARSELKDLRGQAAAARDGKTKIDLGNNLGGERGSTNPISRLLNRIARP